MIRVALPRGDLRVPLAERLRAAGFAVEGYESGSRAYRFPVEGRPGVLVRVFAEQDIPIQVALGQYDLGITSRTWVDELLARYPLDSLVPLRPLDLGGERLVLAAPEGVTLGQLAATPGVRVTTSHPNQTTRCLNYLRVPDYRVIEVWGQPAAWPPEDADAAVLSVPLDDAAADAALAREGLSIVAEVQRGSATLVANREALASRGLAEALEPLLALPAGAAEGPRALPRGNGRRNGADRLAPRRSDGDRGVFRLALPDGHAQPHTVEALASAGLRFEGYGDGATDRRPRTDVEGLEVKVIRPQDMPQAVALGCFDLALTGRDWLAAHLAAFPLSPVAELCDLRRSRYRLGAVVPEAVPAETIAEAVAWWRRDDPERPIRVASEYVSLADHYARERRLGRYQVLPISGASEGFVPDDAEILIEGTETGSTLRANRLRMIDVIMESTNCAIGSTVRPPGARGDLRDDLVERLRTGAAEV